MAKTKFGANAIFSGTQLGLSIISDRCYAYSGAVANAAGGSSTPTTMLEFSTGADLMDVKLFFGVQFAGANDSYLFINMNGQQLMGITYIESGGLNNLTGNPIEFLIPPFSTVQVTWGIDGVTKNGFAMLSGKILNA